MAHRTVHGQLREVELPGEDLRSGQLLEPWGQPEVVRVAVRHHHPRNLLGNQPDPGQAEHQGVLGGRRVRAAVDEGHRLGRDHVHVRRSHRVRRGHDDPFERERPVADSHRARHSMDRPICRVSP